MRFYVPFVTLLVGAAAQSTIGNDLNQKISPQITKLANDVQGFPDSGLDGALAIDSDSKVLATVFNTATEDARNVGSLSFTEGLTILADLSSITNTMTGLLADLTAKNENFHALTPPADSLILSDLVKLNQSSLEYLNALVDDAPVTQVPAYIATKNAWVGAFGQALAVYSSRS